MSPCQRILSALHAHICYAASCSRLSLLSACSPGPLRDDSLRGERETDSRRESRFFSCCHCSSESVLLLVLPWAVNYLVYLIPYSCLTSQSLALACWCSFMSWQSAVLRVPGYLWLSCFPTPVASASLWLSFLHYCFLEPVAIHILFSQARTLPLFQFPLIT